MIFSPFETPVLPLLQTVFTASLQLCFLSVLLIQKWTGDP